MSTGCEDIRKCQPRLANRPHTCRTHARGRPACRPAHVACGRFHRTRRGGHPGKMSRCCRGSRAPCDPPGRGWRGASCSAGRHYQAWWAAHGGAGGGSVPQTLALPEQGPSRVRHVSPVHTGPCWPFRVAAPPCTVVAPGGGCVFARTGVGRRAPRACESPSAERGDLGHTQRWTSSRIVVGALGPPFSPPSHSYVWQRNEKQRD